MSIINNSIIAGASGQAGGAAAGESLSLRFNSGDSSYLSKTFASAGNRKTWTWAAWVKRSALGAGAGGILFTGRNGDPNPHTRIYLTGDGIFAIDGFNPSFGVETLDLFRDPSAWYHFVVVFDSTNSISTERIKLFVNGSRITSLNSPSYPAQDTEGYINYNGEHRICSWAPSIPSYFNGYLADVYFIDGLALGPAYFGYTDSNNVWQPEAFEPSGTTVNDGTTWSSYGTDINADPTPRLWTDAFDGDTSSYVTGDGSTNGQSLFDYSGQGGITVSSSLRLLLSGGTNSFVYVNGSQVAGATSVGVSSPQWYTVTGVSTLNSIGVGNNGSTWSALHAVEVDGVVMVDGSTQNLSYGTNGFHLDFADNSSAAALGYDAAGSNDWDVNNILTTNTVYSNYLTTNDTSSFSYCNVDGFYENPPNSGSGHPATKGFDGLLTTSTATCTNGDGRRITFTPPTAISYSSSVEVYTTEQPNSVYINGTDTGVDTSGNSWVTVASGSGSITSMWFESDSASNPARFAAIRVDGTILVDQSPAVIDSLYDHPTNGDPADDTGLGGEVKGNYCTWNPLNKGANMVLLNGNLDIATTTGTSAVTGTIGVSSGKWYWEMTITGANDRTAIGIAKAGMDLTDMPGDVDALGWSYYADGGTKIHNATSTAYGASFTNGDTVAAALDLDAGTITFYKNGVSQGTAFTGLSGEFFPAAGDGSGVNNANSSTNFGQRPFAHQAPSGFRPLATPFLPTPAIADGSTAMDAVLYTGNNSTNTISGLGFSPDFVWTKARNNLGWNYLTDIIRGGTKPISSNSSAGEDTRNNHIQSWNSDGFTLGPDGTSNGSTAELIAWCWDAGSSNTTYTAGSTPGAGTISCVLRANPTAGCSIVTWTGTGSAGSIAHGLGATPGFIACKDRGTNNWVCQHTSLGSQYIPLNLSEKAYSDANIWSSAAGSSTIAVGNGSNVNGLNRTYVAYCFAPIESYSAMGSYTGNGSTTGDGAFVYCGFRPKWVLIKGSTTTDDDWKIYDSTRSINNVTDDFMTPNDPQLEITNNLNRLDFLSNGFKIRTEGTYALNVNNVPYIWVAFAENPFNYSRAR